MTDINNFCNVILRSNLVNRIEDIVDMEMDATEELQELIRLDKQANEYSSDWKYGEPLIRYSYFSEYIKIQAMDISNADFDAWPYNCIDWDKASAILKQEDYSEIDYDGVSYFIRK